MIVEWDGRVRERCGDYRHLTRRDGVVGVFAVPGIENWFHWLIQALPRLKLLADRGACDAIHVPGGLTAPMAQSLAAAVSVLDVSLDKLFQSPPRTCVEVEAVAQEAVPWRPSDGVGCPPWIVDFLRSLVRAPSTPGSRRIFASRAGYARHDPAVENLCAHLDCDVVDLSATSFQEQASAFASARLVVGQHGSGLANVVFCRPGARVVEIFDPRDPSTDTQVYARLASAAGCSHVLLPLPGATS